MTDATPPPDDPGRAPRIPARAAAVRGDNYQYAVAWEYVCRALTDPGIDSISIEDAGAGQFDDVAARRNDGQPDEYLQIKRLAGTVGGFDLVIDCTGTAPMTAALSIVCAQEHVPFLTGALFHQGAILRVRRQAQDDTPLPTVAIRPTYVNLPTHSP